MRVEEISTWTKGIHNRYDSEVTPPQSIYSELNWINENGALSLDKDSALFGTSSAGTTQSVEVFYGYNRTARIFKKAGTTVDYWNGTAWVAIITGLGATDEITMNQYTANSGYFVYITGPTGLWKVNLANPTTALSMFVSTKNYKGFSFIDKGRMFMWGVDGDPTGLYLSRIDPQTLNYNVVTNEVGFTGNGTQTTFSGTLAFKSANPFAICFNITLVGSAVTASGGGADDNSAIIKPTSGTAFTGTINYTTGQWTMTFTVAPPAGQTCNFSYVWEDSNANGITDFTLSNPRLQSEGAVIRMDYGGDRIVAMYPISGVYLVIKERTVYKFYMKDSDLNAQNDIFRTDVGMQTLRSGVSTSSGVYLINTANPTEPRLKLFTPTEIAEINSTVQDVQITDNKLFQFNLANYDFTSTAIKLWDKWVLIACKQKGSTLNDRILKYQPNQEGGGSVDVSSGGYNSFAIEGSSVYGASNKANEIRNLYVIGTNTISNSVTTADQVFKTETLKKLKRIRIRGIIGKDQALAIYLSFDSQTRVLAGTLRGNGYYSFEPELVASGNLVLGTHPIGSSLSLTEGETPFFMEMKLTNIPKFRKMNLTLEALQSGRVTIQQMSFVDILLYEDRLPKVFRVKQNIAVDGLSINNY